MNSDLNLQNCQKLSVRFLVLVHNSKQASSYNKTIKQFSYTIKGLMNYFPVGRAKFGDDEIF